MIQSNFFFIIIEVIVDKINLLVGIKLYWEMKKNSFDLESVPSQYIFIKDSLSRDIIIIFIFI